MDAQPSVVALWHDIGSVTTPALLIPVGMSLLGRTAIDPRWLTVTMVVPFLVSLTWVLAKFASPSGAYPWSLEPIYPGLAVSAALFATGWAFSRKASHVSA